MAGRRTRKLTQKQVVYAAARKHKVPPWLLWGVYGAESTYGTNGSNYFGLVESSYSGRQVGSTTNLAEDADIAAELLARLKKEHGSWGAAVLAYSGSNYSIDHPRELSRGGQSSGRTLVSVDPNMISPQQQKELEKEGFSKKEIEEATEAPIEKGVEAIPGVKGAEEAIKAPFKIAEDIGDFLAIATKFLFTAEGWIQIGEVSGGIILIGWGLHHLIQASTGVNPTHTVTKTATKAAEVAALVPK